jgi:hypothetical protein
MVPILTEEFHDVRLLANIVDPTSKRRKSGRYLQQAREGLRDELTWWRIAPTSFDERASRCNPRPSSAWKVRVSEASGNDELRPDPATAINRAPEGTYLGWPPAPQKQCNCPYQVSAPVDLVEQTLDPRCEIDIPIADIATLAYGVLHSINRDLAVGGHVQEREVPPNG